MLVKTKVPFADAVVVAITLLKELLPLCERVSIAGSIRRCKPMVSDIELLYIPRVEERPFDLLTTHLVSLAEEHINGWLNSGLIIRRPSVTGVTSWGEKNKFAVHVPSGISLDLFATTTENWWVSLVIRTGSKETNLALANGAIKLGRRLNAYGCGVIEHGEIIPARSERDVFDLCGVPYAEPEDR